MAARGEAKKYFTDVVLSHQGDTCLIWPFVTNSDGYARLRWDGRMQLVSRMVCEITRGAPPTDAHEAAHICGRGAEGCVAPAHMVWKNHLENMADSVLHGTSNRGKRNANSVLTEDDVRSIRQAQGSLSTLTLARRYGVTRKAIRQVWRGENWGWLV